MGLCVGCQDVVVLPMLHARMAVGQDFQTELCAKHCGKQKEWHISLGTLHKKSGSMATLRELRRFRQAIKELVASNDLPDYRLTYDDKKDVLRVRNRDLSVLFKKIKN